MRSRFLQVRSLYGLIGGVLLPFCILGLAARAADQSVSQDAPSDDEGSAKPVSGKEATSRATPHEKKEIIPCGVRSLALMLAYNGAPVPVKLLQEELGAGEEASFFDLARCARARGMEPVGLKMDMADFLRLKVPAIVRLRRRDEFHFTVARAGPDNTKVKIFEPPLIKKPISVATDQFAETFTGEVLLIRRKGKGVTVAQLLGKGQGDSTAEQGRDKRSTDGSASPTQQVEREARPLPTQRDARIQEKSVAAIKLQAESIDFGTVHQSEGELRATFDFRNVGNADLVLGKIRKGCSCTAATVEKRKYAPGEKGEIQVTVDLGSRRGNFRTRITVETNDPKHRSVDLDIACWVVQPAQVFPNILSLGELDVGASADRTLQVRLPTTPAKPNPRIVAVHTPFPELGCTWIPSPKAVNAGIVYDIVCALRPPLSVGPMGGEITIEYEADVAGMLSVSVIGEVFNGITAFPSAVSFGLFTREGAEWEREVTLRSIRDRPLILSEIRCDEPALTVMAVGDGSEGKLLLRVQLDAGKINDGSRISTIIHVRSTVGGQISIPVGGKLLAARSR